MNQFSPNQQEPQFNSQEGVLTQSFGSSFLSQVFLFFGLAVLTSAAGVFTGFQYLLPVFIANPSIMWGIFAAELILVFTSRYWSRLRPINYLLFTGFAFLTGLAIVPLLASVIVEFGGYGLIFKALLATTLMFTGTAVFGWVTQRNLMGLGGFLFTALLGMIIVSVIGIFVPWGNTFEMVFAGFGVILFSAFTMFDMQRIKNSHFDNPLDAALELYLDIFNLFVYIIRLMASFSRD